MGLTTREDTVWSVLDSGAAQYAVVPVSTDATASDATRVELAVAKEAPHADVPRARAQGRIHPLGGIGTVTTLGGESAAADPSGLLPPRREPRPGVAPTRGVLAVQWHRAADAPVFKLSSFSTALSRIENVWPRPRAVVFPSDTTLWGATPQRFWKRVGSWSDHSGIAAIIAALPLPEPADRPRASARSAIIAALRAQPKLCIDVVPVVTPPSPRTVPESPLAGSPLAGGGGGGFAKRGPPDAGEDGDRPNTRERMIELLRESEARADAKRQARWVHEMIRAHLALTVDDVVALYARVKEAERARMRREVVQGSEEWLGLRRGKNVMARVAALLRSRVPVGTDPGSDAAKEAVAEAREEILDALSCGVPRLTSSKAFAVVVVAMSRAMEAARAAGRELNAPPFFAEEVARGARSAEREVREMLMDKLGGGGGFKGSRYTRWGTAHEEGGVSAYAEAARRGLVVGPHAARGSEFAVLSSLSRAVPGDKRLDEAAVVRVEVQRVRDGGGIHVHPSHPFFAFSYDALFRLRPHGSDDWVVRHVEVKCPGNPYASVCPAHRVQIMSMLHGLRAEGVPVSGCDYVVHMPHGVTRITRVPFIQAEADFIMKMLETFLRRELAPLLIARWEGRLPAGSLTPDRSD